MLQALSDIAATYALLEYEGEVRWFAKRHDGMKLGGVCRSVESLQRLRLTSQRGADCYVQLNPSIGFRGTRAPAASVTHYRGFLLDLDPIPGAVVPVTGNPAEPTSLPWWSGHVTAALGQLENELQMPLTPWIIDSGRGVQAWILGYTFPMDTPDSAMIRRSVSAMTKRLRLPAGMIADPRVCDVSRVARLPGTINQKTKQVAKLFSPGALVPALRSSLSHVDPGEPELEDTEALPESIDTYYVVWTRLTGSAQQFITRGWTYPGRHSLLWHTADLLKREGLTRAAAERALWLGARACRPKLARDDVRYALTRAYGSSK